MAIKISIVKGDNHSAVKVDLGSTISDVLDILGINRETVLVKLNGEVVVEEERLKDGDVVEVIAAISGG